MKATEKTSEGLPGKSTNSTPAANGKSTSKKVIRSKGTGKHAIDEKILEDEDSEGTPSKPTRKKVKFKAAAAAEHDEDGVGGIKEESGAGVNGEEGMDGEEV